MMSLHKDHFPCRHDAPPLQRNSGFGDSRFPLIAPQEYHLKFHRRKNRHKVVRRQLAFYHEEQPNLEFNDARAMFKSRRPAFNQLRHGDRMNDNMMNDNMRYDMRNDMRNNMMGNMRNDMMGNMRNDMRNDTGNNMRNNMRNNMLNDTGNNMRNDMLNDTGNNMRNGMLNNFGNDTGNNTGNNMRNDRRYGSMMNDNMRNNMRSGSMGDGTMINESMPNFRGDGGFSNHNSRGADPHGNPISPALFDRPLLRHYFRRQSSSTQKDNSNNRDMPNNSTAPHPSRDELAKAVPGRRMSLLDIRRIMETKMNNEQTPDDHMNKFAMPLTTGDFPQRQTTEINRNIPRPHHDGMSQSGSPDSFPVARRRLLEMEMARNGSLMPGHMQMQFQPTATNGLPSPANEPTGGGGKATKKDKRLKRKCHEDTEKPKRPFSAYNLFFQLEREYIIQSLSEGKDDSPRPDSGKNIDDSTEPMDPNIPERYKKVRLEKYWYRAGLKTKRKHRKTDGSIGFIELTRMISERWGTVEPEIKDYCKKIADEELEYYRKEMEKYKALAGAGKNDKEEKPGGDSSNEFLPSRTNNTVKIPEVTNLHHLSPGVNQGNLQHSTPISETGLPPPPFSDPPPDAAMNNRLLEYAEAQSRKRLREMQLAAMEEANRRDLNSNSSPNAHSGPIMRTDPLKMGQSSFLNSIEEKFGALPDFNHTSPEDFDREVERFLFRLGREIKEKHRRALERNNTSMAMSDPQFSDNMNRQILPDNFRPGNNSPPALPEFEWDC